MSDARVATWDIYPPKIRPNMRAHKSHKITPAKFLYYSKSSYEYMRQETLFIGMGALVGKMGKGKMDNERGVA